MENAADKQHVAFLQARRFPESTAASVKSAQTWLTNNAKRSESERTLSARGHAYTSERIGLGFALLFFNLLLAVQGLYEDSDYKVVDLLN